MLSALTDVRYAIRLLLKTPAFTIVVALTLALGIGANTAMFSVINALLLRPLPYADASRLVMVWQDMRGRGGPATEWTGPANHFDWKAATDIFAGVTTMRGWNATLAGGDVPESLLGEQTTYEYFDVLGAHPALGRLFRPSDDVPNAPRVAILSHALWAARFGSDPSVIGRVVPINGEPHEVIGVMPAGFRSVLVTDAAIWRPLRWPTANLPRNVAIAHTVARLRPDVSMAQARARLNALAARLEQEHPDTDHGRGINPVSLQEQQVGDVRLGLLVLLGAVGFVLLIACVNIANLLLARASGRLREIAVRRALGADRARIIRQLLTESLVLALLGGGAGILLGEWGVSGLKTLAPAGTPRLEEIAIDPHVLWFAAALSLATGLLFGMLPAWQASRDVLAPALKQGGRGQIGDGGRGLRRALVVAELALALVLLVGAGLLLRTFVALQHADLGFNPNHVLTGFVLPPAATYKTAAQRRVFYDRLLERAAALPGVREAALSSVVPLGGDSDTTVTIEGRPKPQTSADAATVSVPSRESGIFLGDADSAAARPSSDDARRRSCRGRQRDDGAALLAGRRRRRPPAVPRRVPLADDCRRGRRRPDARRARRAAGRNLRPVSAAAGSRHLRRNQGGGRPGIAGRTAQACRQGGRSEHRRGRCREHGRGGGCGQRLVALLCNPGRGLRGAGAAARGDRHLRRALVPRSCSGRRRSACVSRSAPLAERSSG